MDKQLNNHKKICYLPSNLATNFPQQSSDLFKPKSDQAQLVYTACHTLANLYICMRAWMGGWGGGGVTYSLFIKNLAHYSLKVRKVAKKSDYSLFINLGPYYSLFIIFFGSLFTIHYKKGHYSLIITPHPDTPVYTCRITIKISKGFNALSLPLWHLITFKVFLQTQ